MSSPRKPGCVRLGERLLAALVGLPDLAVHVVVAAHAAHRVGGDRHALDQRMRVVAHDVAVLERAGLAFVGIADEILLALVLLRHEAPLEAGGKARAAAAAQRRLLHFGDHGRRRNLLGEDLLQRLVAAARDVVGEPPVRAGEARHDDRVGAVVEETVGGRVHRDCPRSRAAQLGEQRVDLFGAHQAAHPLVVDEQHRRVAAGAEALAFLQRDEAVRRRFAEADAELRLEMLRGLRPRPAARTAGWCRS